MLLLFKCNTIKCSCLETVKISNNDSKVNLTFHTVLKTLRNNGTSHLTK